jgi:hypothetical protein
MAFIAADRALETVVVPEYVTEMDFDPRESRGSVTERLPCCDVVRL